MGIVVHVWCVGHICVVHGEEIFENVLRVARGVWVHLAYGMHSEGFISGGVWYVCV